MITKKSELDPFVSVKSITPYKPKNPQENDIYYDCLFGNICIFESGVWKGLTIYNTISINKTRKEKIKKIYDKLNNK